MRSPSAGEMARSGLPIIRLILECVQVEHIITGAEPDFERDLAYEANSQTEGSAGLII